MRKKEQAKLKFKTELCKNSLEGTCEFGSECVFAHGSDELCIKECFQFAQTGRCTYGKKCQFAHLEEPQTCENSNASSTRSSRRNSVDQTPAPLPIFIDLEGRNLF